MSATAASRALDAAEVAYRLHPYAARGPASFDRTGDGYGVEVARALGVDVAQVFKTLVVAVDGLSRSVPAVVVLVPVAQRLDVRALAQVAGAKRAALAEVAVAQRLTGYVVGGISPVGQRRQLPTFVDASAEAWPTIFCSAGRRGLEVELAPSALVALLGATVAPLVS